MSLKNKCTYIYNFLRRLRLLADRSEYFRNELRSINHQTWFLPNDQAFASIGSGLQFLFDRSSTNNENDVNDVRFLYFILFYFERHSHKLVYQITYHTNSTLSKCYGCNKTNKYSESW